MASQSVTAETGIELEFRVRDRECFFVTASANAGCRVELEEMVHQSDGRLLEFFTIRGASPDEVISAAESSPAIADTRLIREDGDESLFEFVVTGPCVGATLADAGAIVRTITAENGVGRVVADVPPHVDIRTVVETFGRRHADSELVARRERDTPGPEFTKREFQTRLMNRLTDKQQDALRTAYAGGYFGWPRESTADECAEALGVSQPTFCQHLRAGEQKLMEALFEGSASRDDVSL